MLLLRHVRVLDVLCGLGLLCAEAAVEILFLRTQLRLAVLLAVLRLRLAVLLWLAVLLGLTILWLAVLLGLTVLLGLGLAVLLTIRGWDSVCSHVYSCLLKSVFSADALIVAVRDSNERRRSQPFYVGA